MNLFQYAFKAMKTSKLSHEKQKNPEKSANKLSWWRRVVTTASLALTWFFASCDKVPNNQVIIDADNWTEQFSFEYHLWWTREPRIIDYNITIYQDWNTYKWIINKKDWRFWTETTIESTDIDGIFEAISRATHNEYISDDTESRKKSKLNFAKEAYKDNILNKTKKWGKSGKFKIKYNK